MNAKNFSLILAGSLWILVGIRIGIRGFGWLEANLANPDWRLGLILLSIIIGILKSNTVLKKSVNNKLDNIHGLENNTINYCFGWAKMLGIKGFILIGGMIGLGILLRTLKEFGFDEYNLLPFLYLGVSLALILSSRYYFSHVKL